MKVSFIIPVYNGGGFMDSCLGSIREQDFPQDELEILVADGGSEDNTRELALKYAARIVENPQRLGEAGKLAALAVASGEIIIFMDADNTIVGRDWLRRSVEASSCNSELLGVEPFYSAHPKDSSLNHYLTTLLHINDPIAYHMAAETTVLNQTSDHVLFEVHPPFNYPTGANGFLFVRSTLQKVYREENFNESEWSRALIRLGHRKLVMLKGCGVAHHYVKGLTDYWIKRKAAGTHYLKRKRDYGTPWFMARGRTRFVAVCLWYTLFFPALIEAIFKAARDRSMAWLWHPVVGWVTLLNHATTYFVEPFLPKHVREKRVRDFVAAAQKRR